jgi:hypothetical protein
MCVDGGKEGQVKGPFIHKDQGGTNAKKNWYSVNQDAIEVDAEGAPLSLTNRASTMIKN